MASAKKCDECDLCEHLYESAEKFVKENYEPVDDKPGYVWFSKRHYQIIKIETLAEALKESWVNKLI